MAREKISGIYCILQIGSENCYVGSSVDVHQRWGQHKRSLNKGDHHSVYLQRAWNFHTELFFDFEVLEIVPSHLIVNGKSLIPFEQAWINLLKPCYNVCPAAGSPLGHKHSKEARAKMSNAYSRNKSHLGRKLSVETRAKISDAHKGKTLSIEHRKKLSIAGIGNKNSLGIQQTPEHRSKISVANTGNKHNLGKKHTLEAKAKMSIFQKTRVRKPHSLETRAKMSAAAKKRKFKLAEQNLDCAGCEL